MASKLRNVSILLSVASLWSCFICAINAKSGIVHCPPEKLKIDIQGSHYAHWNEYLQLRAHVAARLRPNAELRKLLPSMLSRLLPFRDVLKDCCTARSMRFGTDCLVCDHQAWGRAYRPGVALVSNSNGSSSARDIARQYGLLPIDVDRQLSELWNVGPGVVLEVLSWSVQVASGLVITDRLDALTTWVLQKRKQEALPFVDACGKEPVFGQMANAVRMAGALNVLSPGRLTICFWGYLTNGPWGGGAHFLRALSRAFERMGHRVWNVDNTKGSSELQGAEAVDLHIVAHSFQQFPAGLAEKFLPSKADALMPEKRRSKLIFRTDGPQALARGTPRPDEDVKLFQYIHRFSTTATVFQSQWSLNATLHLGHKPVNPVVIGNAADPTDYHVLGRSILASQFKAGLRVRLCVSVWSDSVRKNWDVIQFLDKWLDHTRYEMTLIGRLPEGITLERTRLIPPLNQADLGQALRFMDVFIAPSWNECFSNAEIQAIASGLPVLALQNSSHAEVVREGGRYFVGIQDVLQELDALVANYELYVSTAPSRDIGDAAAHYLEVAGLS